MVDSCAIVTVEALGKDAKNVHPIQKKIVEKNGTQCGFCTPVNYRYLILGICNVTLCINSFTSKSY